MRCLSVAVPVLTPGRPVICKDVQFRYRTHTDLAVFSFSKNKCVNLKSSSSDKGLVMKFRGEGLRNKKLVGSKLFAPPSR